MKILLCLDTKDRTFRGFKANMKGVRFRKQSAKEVNG